MLVTKYIEIDAGHRVPSHKGKCRTPHGHRFLIECGVDDKVIDKKGVSNEGMVIDFSDLKEIMMEVIDKPFDHSGVFYKDDIKKEAIKDFYEGCPKEVVFVDFIPTSENLAKYWYEILKDKLKRKGIAIKYVKVCETLSSSATYQE